MEYTMNADDLARLLRGASITINIQGGTGNTQYNVPVQNNITNNSAIRADDRCCICGGIAGGEDIYYYFGGYWTHWRCERDRDALRKSKQHWQITESIPDELPEPDEPLQIASPEPQQQQTKIDLRAHLAELEERNAEKYQQMLDNAIVHQDAELRRSRDILNYLLSHD